VKLGEAKQVLKSKITEIKGDNRYKAKPALVQVNAPLALIQVEMKALVAAYENALQVLDKITTI
jgi:hypothetical protein